MSELNHKILVFCAWGIGIFVVLWIVVMRLINKRDPLEAAGPPADPGGDSIHINGRLYGLHTIKNLEGDQHWVLSLPLPEGRPFSVHREDASEWIADHFGLTKKVPSGNAHFDEEFEIRSHDEAWTTKFFSNEEHRRLVQELFGLDASAVVLADGRVQAVFEERDSLEEGADALTDLANVLATA